MKLRNKIQKSMILVIVTTLLIAYAMTTVVVYRQNVGVMEREIRQEAQYIKAAIRDAGEGYLDEAASVQKETRLTLIGQDGQVLYDSEHTDEATLENHKNRPEVRQAVNLGEGRMCAAQTPWNRKCFIMPCVWTTGLSFGWQDPWTVCSGPPWRCCLV